ncbi:MAG TPA: FMN-binding protein [Lachnospiraceae bacterium]|nr:FMN-binding protein [Lachnospiraceae bacterium]
MKKKAIIIILPAVLLIVVAVLACYRNSRTIKDGYYTAEMADTSYGWREYLCIQVKNGIIMSAEFNAKNDSGFIKSWDNAYMKNMNPISGTYPNKYTREYVQQLIDGQEDMEVDLITGATESGYHFKKLVAAVLEQARKGDSKIKTVESDN